MGTQQQPPSDERPEAGQAAPMEPDEDGAIVLGPSDTLDLHPFRPRDIASVVVEFLAQAMESGFTRVRLIHGKGIGVQRETVRQILERDPNVLSFGDADDASGWGATIAVLRPWDPTTTGGSLPSPGAAARPRNTQSSTGRTAGHPTSERDEGRIEGT